MKTCNKCGGHGQQNHGMERCHHCNGRGEVIDSTPEWQPPDPGSGYVALMAASVLEARIAERERVLVEECWRLRETVQRLRGVLSDAWDAIPSPIDIELDGRIAAALSETEAAQ